jgi:hypothetical protein
MLRWKRLLQSVAVKEGMYSNGTDCPRGAIVDMSTYQWRDDKIICLKWLTSASDPECRSRDVLWFISNDLIVLTTMSYPCMVRVRSESKSDGRERVRCEAPANAFTFAALLSAEA